MVREEKDLIKMLHFALKSPKGLGDMLIEISEEQLSVIARFANGDARTASSFPLLFFGESNNLYESIYP